MPAAETRAVPAQEEPEELNDAGGSVRLSFSDRVYISLADRQASLNFSTPDESDQSMVLELYIPVAMIQYLGCTLRPPAFALINGSGNSRLNLAVALLDGVACRIGLSILLGVTFAWGITGFWYGNAISGCVPFVIGFAFLLSGRWKIIKEK